MRILVAAALLLSSSMAAAQAPLSGVVETAVANGRQLKGLVTLTVDGQPVTKRFVIRVPAPDKDPARQAPVWNGSLVIGAHGGSGGNAVDRAGKVYATSETALDDVIGQYVFDRGFAYASVDRDGITGTRSGFALTMQFQAAMHGEVTRLGKATPRRTYVVGLSAGGGIARMLAEAMPTPFDGALIIAGAGGDLVTRLDRQTKMASLWPLIDPRAHAGLSANDAKIRAYASAVGTPVEARRLWPYTGAGAVAAGTRPQIATEETTGLVKVPTIEVAGTWDDLVIREIRAYGLRVQPRERHRLYLVNRVWHMSGDDDGVQGFQYAAESRMKLDKDVADAMGEGPSYIPTVREAFDRLVRWVEDGATPPASQTIEPGARLK
jgi:pimeloyl-ACP methyl ester carboxylesterase